MTDKVKIFLSIILLSLPSLNCLGQIKIEVMNNDTNCLSQNNMLNIYSSIRELILKNSKTETMHENYAVASFKCNDIVFSHRIIPDNSEKGFPDFNMETIDILSTDVNYQLIFVGHQGGAEIKISTKDYSEEKVKLITKKAADHFCTILSQLNLDKIKLTSNEVIDIINNEDKDFLGTWIDISLKNYHWHISTRSKSAKAPNYCIIDDETGNILLKVDNTDDRIQKEG